MNRATFGSWGAGLDEFRFAAALAALGVANGRTGSQALDEVDIAWRSPMMRWRLPEWPVDTAEPDRLADAWLWNRSDRREAAARLADPGASEALPRVAVEWASGEDPTWLLDQLSREAIGPLGVHISQPAGAGRVRWIWPLDVGLLEGTGSESLAYALRAEEEFWFARFATPRTLAGGGTCDLLLIADPIRAAAGRLLSAAVRASCVLMLRPPAGPWSVTGPLLRALQAHVGASGIGFAPVPPGRSEGWLEALLVSLAHNHPLDVALRNASRAAGSAPPLLLADEALLEETRLSSVLKRLEARAARGRASVFRDGNADERLLMFDSELHGASELILLGRELRPAADEPDPPRYIQACVSTVDRTPLQGPLEPGADHVIAVRVGPPDAGWWSASSDPFPAPEGGGPHRLTVVLTAPDVLPEPLMDEIVLPASGPSTECEFRVRPGPEATRLRARIILLHGNRVLQTARLDLPVGDDAEGTASLAAEPEAAVHLRLDDLDSRRPFDAALVLNHDDSGAPGVTAIAGGRARMLMPHEFQDAVNRIRDILEDAVLEPTSYGGLEDDSTVALLTTLAYHGFTLHETFLNSEGAQSVVEADRLQLVALRDGADFPLEFVYDRIAPEPGATLCPGAAAGLRAGTCGDGCARVDDPSVVCPLAFWGLTKSIERQPYRGPVENYELEVRAEPSGELSHLSAPETVLFAASSRVAAADVTALGKTLGVAMPGQAQLATSWGQWRDSIAAKHPALLVLLPHTLAHPQFEVPAMEISDDAPLARNNVREDLVCPSRAHRPVVILLGCNTAATKVPIDAFPPRFHSQGAAIVLGTVTKVLGRHAAPIAGMIATELVTRARAGETYITDIVRDVRRTLLADGQPMGLTLVAYGDGEWMFGGT